MKLWVHLGRELPAGRCQPFDPLVPTALPLYSVADSDLDSHISELQRGSRVLMLQRSHGMYVQRNRICASAQHVNPTIAIMRWQQAVSQRRYSVPGPISLSQVKISFKILQEKKSEVWPHKILKEFETYPTKAITQDLGKKCHGSFCL